MDWVEAILVSALSALLLALGEIARRYARDLDARDLPEDHDQGDTAT